MWELAIVPVLSVLLFWTWQFINWVWLKPRKMEKLLRKQGMKGNPYKFLFGDSKETFRMYERAYSKPIGIKDDVQPRLLPNLFECFQKYGDFSFTWFGPRPRILVMDPGAAREVLNKRLLYVKNYELNSEEVKMITTGLAKLEGDEWSKSRSKINPAFKLDQLKPMVPAIQVCSEDTLNEWRDLASKGGGSCVVDAFSSMEVLTGSVLARLMFNTSYTGKIKNTFHLLAKLGLLARVHSKTFSMPGEKYLPTKINRKANEIHGLIVNSLISMINERLEKWRKTGGVDEGGYRDLLNVFMEKLYDENISKRDRKRIVQDVIGQCKIFFYAGFETSSNALTWALVLLSIHQDVQARAREEVFQVLGDKKEITSDDVAQLKHITMIINETLRLYPSVMELTRLVDPDAKIKDYTIPKGSLITVPILMIHRNPEIWGKDAGEFRPERFADGAAKAANGEAAFMPFGWGPRICIGMNFAMMEAKILLATFLRQFSFELSPTYTHAPMVAMTIQPQYGAPLVLKKL